MQISVHPQYYKQTYPKLHCKIQLVSVSPVHRSVPFIEQKSQWFWQAEHFWGSASTGSHVFPGHQSGDWYVGIPRTSQSWSTCKFAPTLRQHHGEANEYGPLDQSELNTWSVEVCQKKINIVEKQRARMVCAWCFLLREQIVDFV